MTEEPEDQPAPAAAAAERRQSWRQLIGWTLLIVAVCTAAALAPQIWSGLQWARARWQFESRWTGQKYDFEVVDEPAGECFKHLEHLGDINSIRLSGWDEKKPVTLKLNQATLKECYREVCRAAGLDYQYRRGDLVVIFKPGSPEKRQFDAAGLRWGPSSAANGQARKLLQKKVNFEFIQAPLFDAVSFLEVVGTVRWEAAWRDPASYEDGRNSEEGQRTVTLRCNLVTMEAAADLILRLSDLTAEVRDGRICIRPAHPPAR